MLGAVLEFALPDRDGQSRLISRYTCVKTSFCELEVTIDTNEVVYQSAGANEVLFGSSEKPLQFGLVRRLRK